MMQHRPFTREKPGNKKAVLFIHGILGSPVHFRDLYAAVPQDTDIHAILLAGHGGKAQDFSRASMAQWRQQVENEIAALYQRYGKIVIAAHSMGGLLAVEAALQQPEKVESLFLLNLPLHIRPRLSYFPTALRVAMGKARQDRYMERTGAIAYSIQPTQKLWLYLGWLPRYTELFALSRKVRKSIARLQLPLRVFQADRDELVSPRLPGCLAPSVTRLKASTHSAYTREEAALLRNELAKLLAEQT